MVRWRSPRIVVVVGAGAGAGVASATNGPRDNHRADDESNNDGEEACPARAALVVMSVVSVVSVALVAVVALAVPPKALLLPPFFGELERVLHATGTHQDVRVIRVIVPFAHNRGLAEPVRVVEVGLAFPLCVVPVRTTVVALDHRWVVQALRRAADAFGLWHRGGAPACGGEAMLEGEHADVLQAGTLVRVRPRHRRQEE